MEGDLIDGQGQLPVGVTQEGLVALLVIEGGEHGVPTYPRGLCSRTTVEAWTVDGTEPRIDYGFLYIRTVTRFNL